VSVNTAALADPLLISRLAERFGSQCVVVAVDGKRVGEKVLAVTHGGRKVTEREIGEWVAEAEARGAGEILLTSVDADGTQEGFDLPMLRAVRQVTKLPIVASGGAGKLRHFAEAVTESGADAVLAASVFHDRVFTIGEVKKALASRGLPVRLPTGSPLPGVRFGKTGLVPVLVRDAGNGQVLTLAWANAEALEKTATTGLTHFFSRSRKSLWRKGDTSGNTQRVVSISLDCDGDAVLYDVVPSGPACHLGTRSCFAPMLNVGAPPVPKETIDLAPLFEVVARRKAKPETGSYTNELLTAGLVRIAQKVGEEGVETALSAVTGDDDALAGEVADLLYHVVVLLAARGVPASAVEKKLAGRRVAKKAK
jgi:phosphoribosyl-ATP pyrophosphohydrolase